MTFSSNGSQCSELDFSVADSVNSQLAVQFSSARSLCTGPKRPFKQLETDVGLRQLNCSRETSISKVVVSPPDDTSPRVSRTQLTMILIGDQLTVSVSRVSRSEAGQRTVDEDDHLSSPASESEASVTDVAPA